MRHAILIILYLSILISPTKAQPDDDVDFIALAEAINSTMRAYHYDPSQLESEDYQVVENKIIELGKTAVSEEDFLNGFSEIWREGPFSHVLLRKAQQSAEETAAYLDQLRIGGGGATLIWNENIAILTVNTMMGLDTIEEIDAAYEVILENHEICSGWIQLLDGI